MAKDFKPLVSVCIITYNHEQYITQCLNSVIAQQTNFDFEVIIGVDASVDRTAEVVADFANTHPTVVTALIQQERIGGNPNYMLVHQKAQGKYVACLDGDDAMLPGKLQKQFDFLERNLHCAFVAHKTFKVIGEQSTFSGVSPEVDYPTSVPLDYMILNYLWFDHCSKMYRRSADDFEFGDPIDFEIHIEHAIHGDIGFINEPLGIKRAVENSITDVSGSRLDELITLTLNGFDRAAALGVNPGVVNLGLCSYCFATAIGFAEQSNEERSLFYLQKALDLPCHKKPLMRLTGWVNQYTPWGFVTLKALSRVRTLLHKIKSTGPSSEVKQQWSDVQAFLNKK